MRFGLTYSIERGAGRSAVEKFHEAVEEICLAESLGFDCVFISEHHFLEDDFFPSTLIALSYVAAKTAKIRLGPGVLLLPLHDPVHIAEDAAVLDLISGGRLILGIGQGYRPEEFRAFGRELKDRPSLLREGATLIRKLWTEQTTTYHGKHFHADGVTLTPKPAQKPAPPIWVAAKKRKAVELAAEVGDAWYADPITPLSIIRENVGHWERALTAHGKKRSEQEFAYYREWGIGPDEKSAWEQNGEAIMGEYRRYLGFGHLVDDEGRPIPPGREDLLLDLVRQRTTIGGPERAREDLQMIQETLNPTHVICKLRHAAAQHEHVMAAIRLTAEKVIARL